jgi:hypothetical protein
MSAIMKPMITIAVFLIGAGVCFGNGSDTQLRMIARKILDDVMKGNAGVLSRYYEGEKANDEVEQPRSSILHSLRCSMFTDRGRFYKKPHGEVEKTGIYLWEWRAWNYSYIFLRQEPI